VTTKYWCPKCDITVKGAAVTVCMKCQRGMSQCDDVGDEYATDEIKRLRAENERLRAEAHHAQALRAALCVARAALVDPIRLTLTQIDAALVAHAAHLKAGDDP